MYRVVIEDNDVWVLLPECHPWWGLGILWTGYKGHWAGDRWAVGVHASGMSFRQREDVADGLLRKIKDVMMDKLWNIAEI
jgi:hypothetical protein